MERGRGGEVQRGLTFMEPGATSASPIIRFTVLCTWHLRNWLKAEENSKREGVES